MSDCKIIIKSGHLDFESGDCNADKGFTITNLLAAQSVSPIIPLMKTQDQFTKARTIVATLETYSICTIRLVYQKDNSL